MVVDDVKIDAAVHSADLRRIEAGTSQAPIISPTLERKAGLQVVVAARLVARDPSLAGIAGEVVQADLRAKGLRRDALKMCDELQGGTHVAKAVSRHDRGFQRKL